MSRKPSDGIGDRVARYRRLAGLSAREVAEQAGNGLTRGVIANIESGRKTDVTVDQLIALAYVLQVPPVVLAIPVDKPDVFVRTADGVNSMQAIRAASLMDWFTSMDAMRSTPREREREAGGNPATFAARELIRTLREYRVDRDSLSRMRESGNLTGDELRVRELELEDTETTLRQLGVDLTVYRIDE